MESPPAVLFAPLFCINRVVQVFCVHYFSSPLFFYTSPRLLDLQGLHHFVRAVETLQQLEAVWAAAQKSDRFRAGTQWDRLPIYNQSYKKRGVTPPLGARAHTPTHTTHATQHTQENGSPRWRTP